MEVGPHEHWVRGLFRDLKEAGCTISGYVSVPLLECNKNACQFSVDACVVVWQNLKVAGVASELDLTCSCGSPTLLILAWAPPYLGCTTVLGACPFMYRKGFSPVLRLIQQLRQYQQALRRAVEGTHGSSRPMFDTDAGVRCDTEIIIGLNTKVVGPVANKVVTNPTLDNQLVGLLDQLTRHHIEEMGNFEHFLADLYNRYHPATSSTRDAFLASAGSNISEAAASVPYSRATEALAALFGPDSAVVSGKSEGREQDRALRQQGEYSKG
eukprot:1150406-Pelagomonas_calceolata.AAC.3